jgi:gluconate kinase
MKLKYKNNMNIWFLIGPSGSGKSTVAKALSEKHSATIYSFDEMRHRYYGADKDYLEVWEESCKDDTFKQRTLDEFKSLIECKSDIIVDNINVTVKSRRRLLSQVPKTYKKIAVVFDTDLTTMIMRQSTRSDKHLSERVVTEQFNALQKPEYPEFDEIINVKDI